MNFDQKLQSNSRMSIRFNCMEYASFGLIQPQVSFAGSGIQAFPLVEIDIIMAFVSYFKIVSIGC